MKSVALVIGDLGGGGTQRVLTNLAHALQRRGHDVTVITLAGPEQDAYRLDATIRRICVGGVGVSSNPIMAMGANLSRMAHLRRAVKESRARSVVSFICPMNVLMILACLGLSVRVVISERNDPALQSLGRSWDFLRWLLYRFADAVTANSHGALRTLTKYVPHNKLAYVPNPLIIPPSNEPARREGNTVLAVGRLHQQKAYDVLLDAFARLKDRAPGWKLVCLGDGPERETLLQQAQELGITDRVIWEGRVSDPFPRYRSADIYVLPSRHEGTPNALLEAMGCGVASIVSDASPGPLDYVEHEISGLVFPANEPQRLADAIERMIGDANLRSRLGEEGSRRVEALRPENALPIWERVIWPE